MLKTLALLLGLILVPIQANAWSLNWTPSVGTVDGYMVEISTDGGINYDFVYVLGPETTFPLDDKCKFNNEYTFRVSAFNAAGVSPPSPSITWTRPAYVPPVDSTLPVVNNGPSPENPDSLNVTE